MVRVKNVKKSNGGRFKKSGGGVAKLKAKSRVGKAPVGKVVDARDKFIETFGS
jgi:hypothetical protein